VARQPEARLHHVGPAREADDARHPRAHEQPDDLPEGDPGSVDYDEQFKTLASTNRPILDDYWSMVLHDINSALDVFAPLYHQSYGGDGYVSVEVAPTSRTTPPAPRRRRAACTRSSTART
jgi:hypothetical protein